MEFGKTKSLAAAVLIVLLSGCATIINTDSQKVMIDSEPGAAAVTIYDETTGRPVSSGVTPYTAKLKRGAGYFKAAQYRVVIEKEGCETQEVIIEGHFDPVYVANLLFAAPIGMLIVDPISGGMWTLDPKDVKMVLEQKDMADETTSSAEQTMVVIEVSELSPELKSRMIPLGQTQ